MSERDIYIEKAKARLDQWNADIAKMQAKVEEAQADAKIDYRKQLEDMRKQRDEAEVRLKELRAAGDDAWSDMKAGFDSAWKNLSDAFEQAAGRFR